MSDNPAEAVNDALTGLRRAVRDQLGVERPPPADVDPDSLVRFSPDLPRQLEPGGARAAGRASRGARPLAAGAVPPGGRPRGRGRLALRSPLAGARSGPAREPRRDAGARRGQQRGLRPVHVQPPRSLLRARLRALRLLRPGGVPRVRLRHRHRPAPDRLAAARPARTRAVRRRALQRGALPRAPPHADAPQAAGDGLRRRHAAARLDDAG